MRLDQIMALLTLEVRGNLTHEQRRELFDGLAVVLDSLDTSDVADVVATATRYDKEHFLNVLNARYEEQGEF